MSAGVTAEQRLHRLRRLLQEGVREARRHRHAERVPVETAVLGGDPAFLAGNSHFDGTTLALELAEHRLTGIALRHPLVDLGVAEVPEPAKDHLELIAIDRPRLLDPM